ncbi:MAG: hypothetical protein ACFCD0_01590 [Gemmataceae bacterium]
MQKSLDQKLARIHADPHGCKDFILADAKDADMALSIGAPGKSPEAHGGELKYRTLAEYRNTIEQIVCQGLVDLVLMSANTSKVLTIHKRLFDNSPVTPAVRANDITDVHIHREEISPRHPSALLQHPPPDHMSCGHVDCRNDQRTLGVDLGLYSITVNNNAAIDCHALEEYQAFRIEAERNKFRHFLEIFDPNLTEAVASESATRFINDVIVRTLGSMTSKGRPVFLKMVYHGPKAMEELIRHHPQLVVGILGGAAGTTYDAFKLLSEAKKYGAKIALFGRKINNAENQLAFIRFLRLIADGEVTAEEAVLAYHAVLERLNIRPHRSLEEDTQLRTAVMNYAGSGTTYSLPSSQPQTSPAMATTSCNGGCQCNGKCKVTESASPQTESSLWTGTSNGEPDFTKMTPAQKVAYHLAKWDRILGS